MVEENEQAESYGKLFRELREQKHISLREAAFGILSKSQLSRFELGENDISLSKFLLLLENINFSMAEFLEISDQHENKKNTRSFEEAGLLEQNGKISELLELCKKESLAYQRSEKFEHHLNSIALKAVLCNYGKYKRLSQYELEILIEYFVDLTTWSRYDLYVFLFTLHHLPYDMVKELTKDLLSQKNFYEKIPENQNLILMTLRNLSVVMVEHNEIPQAQAILEKFREVGKTHWSINVGIAYELIRANLYEAHRDFQKSSEILEDVVFVFERFGNSATAKIYCEEIKKLRKKQGKRP